MNNAQSEPKLVRGLNFIDAFSLVIGCVIGTGVFIKAAIMTQTVGSAPYVMMAWVVAGLLSLSGALVYAEIGSIYPQAGGEYIYLRESFGTFPAYLYGWTRVLIASPSSLAAFTVGAAKFLSSVISLDAIGGVKSAAISFMILFTILNCMKVTVGGRFQSVITMLKIVLICGISMMLFAVGHGDLRHFSQYVSPATGWPGWSAMGVAVLSALWAYDGWNNMPMIAGEVKNPKRNVPLALILGMFAALFLYSAINLAYFYILPVSDVATSYSSHFQSAMPVAIKSVTSAFGGKFGTFMSILFVISAVGALNGSMMSSARVPFALAADGLFFSKVGRISSKTHVPVTALILQCVLSSIFVLWLDFDKLTDYVVFSSWIFYAMVTASIFKLRKNPNIQNDGYKTWGYPWMPIIFIILAILLLINTVYASPKDTMIGLLIIAAGVPFYFWFKKQNLHKPQS